MFRTVTDPQTGARVRERSYWGAWHLHSRPALCANGAVRRVTVTGQADTFFSVPARVTVRRKGRNLTVSGYLWTASDFREPHPEAGAWRFTGTGRNAWAVGHWPAYAGREIVRTVPPGRRASASALCLARRLRLSASSAGDWREREDLLAEARAAVAFAREERSDAIRRVLWRPLP